MTAWRESNFPFGQRVRLDFTLTDEDDALVNAEHISIKVETPDGDVFAYNETTPGLEHPDTGRYVLRVIGSEAGIWWVRGETTGTGPNAAVEHSFRIDHSHFPA